MIVAFAPPGGDDKPAPLPPQELVWPNRDAKIPKLGHADLASLKRLIANYDFEDAERFPRELPPDWYRILTAASARPGFPDFGSIGLTNGQGHGGKWSLECKLDGGSLAVALPPGLVRVFPGSRYR